MQKTMKLPSLSVMGHLLSLLFIFMLTAQPVFSQDSIEDSLRQRFNDTSLPDSLRAEAATELVGQIVYRLPAQADSLAQDALQLPAILPKQVPVLVTRRAISFAVRGQTGHSISLFEQTAKSYLALGDSLSYAGALHNASIGYAELGQYEEAIDFLERSIAIKSRFEGSKLASGLLQVGALHAQLKRKDKAFSFYRQALQHLAKEDGSFSASEKIELNAAIYGNLGIVYLELEEYDSAYFYRRKSYDGYKSQQNAYYVLLACNDLSEIFLGLDQPDSAKTYLQEANSLVQQLQVPDFTGRYYLSKAAYFLKTKQTDSAKVCYDKAAEVHPGGGH